MLTWLRLDGRALKVHMTALHTGIPAPCSSERIGGMERLGGCARCVVASEWLYNHNCNFPYVTSNVPCFFFIGPLLLVVDLGETALL